MQLLRIGTAPKGEDYWKEINISPTVNNTMRSVAVTNKGMKTAI